MENIENNDHQNDDYKEKLSGNKEEKKTENIEDKRSLSDQSASSFKENTESSDRNSEFPENNDNNEKSLEKVVSDNNNGNEASTSLKEVNKVNEEESVEPSDEAAAPEGIKKDIENKEDAPGVDEKVGEKDKTVGLHGEVKGHEKVRVNTDTEEVIDYNILSKKDLVNLFAEMLNKKSIPEIGHEVNDLYEIFQKKHDAELQEKKRSFLDSGGLEQDFKPVEDPEAHRMEELMEKFRSLKAEHNKQLEKIKNENLAEKNEILEQFRILMESPESFDSTFRKFKQLQKRWFDIGIVPKQNLKDLWNSYNFFVDKFNDYVNINKELRQLDYKKNLDQKLQLCEKAENLIHEKNIVTAFKRLQKLHSQWRDVGPVPIENKDEIWQRFKAATSVINKAHQEYQSQLKDSLSTNLEKKTLLCEKAEALLELELDSHNKWAGKTNELLTIQKEWKTIGYAPKKVNNQIYNRFRKACDAFFDRKAKFYAQNFAEQNENLEVKKIIINEAENLKDNTDWKATTDKLISLQKKWKSTGPVPRKDSDKLWKQFRAACDHFFEKKSSFFSGNDESHEENLKLKKELIQNLESEVPPDSLESMHELLQKYQEEFDDIGFVPIEKKDVIRDEYKKAMDQLIDQSKLTDSDKSGIRYRMKILGLIHGPRAENKLNFERDKLLNKLQQLQNDIGIWENNIGFFKETKSSEGTISDFQKKLDDAKERILILERKIEIIDELDLNT